MNNYPRKCDICNHSSNSPSAYFYHIRKHEVIPKGILCEHGCGNLANFKNTNNKFTCLENAHNCPEYLKRHSIQVQNQWNGRGNKKRRKETSKTAQKYFTNKLRKENHQKLREKYQFIYAKHNPDYRAYARLCRVSAQRWAKNQGYKLGKQTLHVDHIFSIFDGFKKKVSPKIMSHPCNLQILTAKQNSSKGFKSAITKEELLRRIKAMEEN